MPGVKAVSGWDRLFRRELPKRRAYLSGIRLADEAGGLLLCDAIVEAETLDVGVSGGAIVAVRALDLADLHHLCACSLRFGDRDRYRRVGGYFGRDRCGRGEEDGGNAGIQEVDAKLRELQFSKRRDWNGPCASPHLTMGETLPPHSTSRGTTASQVITSRSVSYSCYFSTSKEL